jgi:glutamate dehydrogenase/leucine dehydrogenase
MNIDLTIGGIEDDLGPSKVLWIRQPSVGLEAFLVVDNVACGPAIGGIRMATDVTAVEVARLARAMTLKNAAAGLPHGGGKAGIIGNPSLPIVQKEQLVRAFAHAVRDVTEYIPGPDMGLNEEAMAWIKDEIERAVGLPKVLGGIPLDEIGATGFGLAISAEVAAARLALDLRGARIVIQGFGAVGMHAARFLEQRGGKLVAASDSRGAIFNADGLSVESLIAHKRSARPMREFSQGKSISGDDLIGLDCDIWIPAARPDVLNETNVNRLKAHLVLQGANIPATSEAEQWMHENGILNVPDFIANAGGVICASVEYHGGTQSQATAAIEDRIRSNTSEVLDRAQAAKCMPRQAAVQMARSRVEEAMRYRRY